MKKLFGTNGIRGVYGEELTTDLIRDVTFSMAKYFEKGPILIGFDGRHNNEEILEIVCSSFNDRGIDVQVSGLVPTPCLQYGTKKLNVRAGIMLTASHNPPQYNGIKVVDSDGVEISREAEQVIEKIYNEKSWNADPVESGKREKSTDIIKLYIDGIKSLINVNEIKSTEITVAADLGNGAQAVVIEKLLSELGCRCIAINGKVDGSFPGRGPEPTPENLQDLSKAVTENNASFGVAFDGDGDRSIFCDQDGKILTGDISALLLTRYLLAKNPESKVITTVNSSSAIEKISSKTNSEVIRTKVGSVDVSRKMIVENGLIGFEENGGFMFSKHNSVRDGAMTMSIIIDMLGAKKDLAKELNDLPKSFTKKGKYKCSQEQAKALTEHLKTTSDGQFTTVDGIKINFAENRWVMVRASGTEPIIRVYCEGQTKEDLDGLYQQYCDVIEKFLNI